VKLRDTEAALDSGADEIDMVIDRGAFLAGDEATVFAEIAAVKKLCGTVRLKAILETGELGSYDATRRASDLALAAGADLIKTPPALIVDTAAAGWSDFSMYPMSNYPVLADFVATRYHVVATVDEVVVYAPNN